MFFSNFWHAYTWINLLSRNLYFFVYQETEYQLNICFFARDQRYAEVIAGTKGCSFLGHNVDFLLLEVTIIL